MILYHGTNADIDAIDLNRGLRHKDFGKGFYLTPDRNTAVRMAQKKTRLFGGTVTLITYEMDDTALRSDLKVKIFPEKACVEWLIFVDANRDRKNVSPIHETGTSTNNTILERRNLSAFSIKQTLNPYEAA